MWKPKGINLKTVGLCIAAFEMALMGLSGTPRAGELVRMRTLRQIAVYGSPSRGERPVARIHYGAVLEVEKTGVTRGCQQGWGRLTSNGYVCLSHLKETDAEATVAPEDDPAIDQSFERYVVKKGGAYSFANRRQFAHRIQDKYLYGGTVLAVKQVIIRGNTPYLITRDGQYVQGDNVEKMSPVWSLGHHVKPGEPEVTAYVINDNVVSRENPDENAPVVREYSKFEVLEGRKLLESVNGWVALPDGSYMADADLGRVRKAQISFEPMSDEKWIAVDLGEQVVSAYVGEQRVYVTLGSTGKKGNTETGAYRIKWKRRLQTMNLYGGHLRVDDVQWVMYYIPKRGFALHTAWHNNFGHPVSHGCVNLPRDDARWFYEWTSPTSFPFESEDFHSDYENGTRVIVF